MRRIVDGLIVVLGLGVLLLLEVYTGPHSCQDHPFFILQGTSEDCAARDSPTDRRSMAAQHEAPVSKPVAALASR